MPKDPTKIQAARGLLKSHGFGEYTVVKRTKKPSRKGDAFQIKMFKKFSKWATGRDKPLVFWETGGSGAQATVTGDKTSYMVGDMRATRPEGMFLMKIAAFEFKDRIDLDVLDFIYTKQRAKIKTLLTHWEEIYQKALASERKALLVFHRHGTSLDYIVMSDIFYTRLENYLGLHDFGRINVHWATIMVLDHFLEWVKPWNLAYCFFDDNDEGNAVEASYGRQKRKRKRLK